jgi:hypothetical protein
MALAAFQTYIFGRTNILAQRGLALRRRISPDVLGQLHADDYFEFALDVFFAGLAVKLP